MMQLSRWANMPRVVQEKWDEYLRLSEQLLPTSYQCYPSNITRKWEWRRIKLLSHSVPCSKTSIAKYMESWKRNMEDTVFAAQSTRKLLEQTSRWDWVQYTTLFSQTSWLESPINSTPKLSISTMGKSRYIFNLIDENTVWLYDLWLCTSSFFENAWYLWLSTSLYVNWRPAHLNVEQHVQRLES